MDPTQTLINNKRHLFSALSFVLSLTYFDPDIYKYLIIRTIYFLNNRILKFGNCTIRFQCSSLSWVSHCVIYVLSFK